MGPYVSSWVFSGPFNVVVCSYVFLWVLMGPSVSLLVLSGPYKS